MVEKDFGSDEPVEVVSLEVNEWNWEAISQTCRRIAEYACYYYGTDPNYLTTWLKIEAFTDEIRGQKYGKFFVPDGPVLEVSDGIGELTRNDAGVLVDGDMEPVEVERGRIDNTPLVIVHREDPDEELAGFYDQPEILDFVRCLSEKILMKPPVQNIKKMTKEPDFCFFEFGRDCLVGKEQMQLGVKSIKSVTKNLMEEARLLGII